ncbi:MAG TPA: polymorphic toxin-type HINT domain-containing protein [Schlesneria sp.]|jgi:hypothetical protein
MNRFARCLLSIAWASFSQLEFLEAANPAGTNTTTSSVQQLLTLEAQPSTKNLDRRLILNPTVRPEAAATVEWWQAGFVKTSKGWQTANAISVDGSYATAWEEYQNRRKASVKTMESQLALADWCSRSKLPEQERAHLMQVLMLAPPNFDSKPIYKRMGYRLVGGQWLTTSDQREQEAAARRHEQQLREWRSVAERIGRNWNTNAKQRKSAEAELKKIENSAAIPALLMLSQTNEALAQAICGQLANLPSFEAAQALATIAVQSEWASVRETAAKCLKSKRIDDFAPILLAEMRTLFRTDKSPGNPKPNLMIREQADRYLAVDPDVVPIGVPILITYSPKRDRITSVSIPGPTGRNATDRDRAVGDSIEKIHQQLDAENDLAEEYNIRAAKVLAEVTCQPECVDPTYWWAWWNLYTGTQPIPKKCQLIRPGPQVQVPSGVRVICCSCLTAGTPICTRQGFVAIDKIQVGDEVLSKNIDTGEIDYRPVLQTTERQPVPVTKFVVAGTAITASEGHHFWVSGTGWSKTRELAAGQPIHTATGMSRIESTALESQPAAVYNLVVADFHTYFVGAGMILSHDVAQPSPTNVKVPGLEVD